MELIKAGDMKLSLNMSLEEADRLMWALRQSSTDAANEALKAMSNYLGYTIEPAVEQEPMPPVSDLKQNVVAETIDLHFTPLSVYVPYTSSFAETYVPEKIAHLQEVADYLSKCPAALNYLQENKVIQAIKELRGMSPHYIGLKDAKDICDLAKPQLEKVQPGHAVKFYVTASETY